MATVSKAPAEQVMMLTGGPPTIMEFGEAANQSFKAGEFVRLVSGLVTAATVTSTDIVGMALADASGTTGTKLNVLLATGDTVFTANTSASIVLATAKIGATSDMAIETNQWRINTAGVATKQARIINFDPRDANGDVNGRYLFIVISSARVLL